MEVNYVITQVSIDKKTHDVKTVIFCTYLLDYCACVELITKWQTDDINSICEKYYEYHYDIHPVKNL